MGLRFRRSVRLFPGVRLNFSHSGVSTSVGVRGASITLGARGVYGNVGIPGSGLSYRTRLGGPARTSRPIEETRPWKDLSPTPNRARIFSPGVAAIPGTEVEVKSGDVGTLTSPGLDELKQLINDAGARHAELRAELVNRTDALNRAARRLRR